MHNSVGVCVSGESATAFFSYSRSDSEFALRLAEDLKSSGADVWIDQLDIDPGQEWDSAIESALSRASRMILILTPESVKSRKVRNEIAYALDEDKTVIPILRRECAVPLQLRRVQYIDFRADYQQALKGLLKVLPVEQAGQKQKAATASNSSSIFIPLTGGKSPLDDLLPPKVSKFRVPSLEDFAESLKKLPQMPPVAGDLFPVYGITPGTTTVQQVELLGYSRTDTIDEDTGEPYECYVVNGVNFWYDKQGVVDHIYITHSRPMPPQWRSLGFDWALSYSGWISLLKRMGYATTINKPPHTEEYNGAPSFAAEVVGSKQNPFPHEIEIYFNYSKGTTTDSRDTLYSLLVRLP